jgi:hypothetical protein
VPLQLNPSDTITPLVPSASANPKRPRGRPKGSKNKAGTKARPIINEPKRGRGRPKGSRNKPKQKDDLSSSDSETNEDSPATKRAHVGLTTPSFELTSDSSCKHS